jgi:phage FluMu protein Com
MSEDCSKYASEDCYIYADDEEQKIRMQCIECHKANKLGGLWRATSGYGMWEIKCHHCGKVIHKPNELEENVH